MAELDDWIEIIRREASIGIGQREKKSTLVATSYNPKTHAIKGMLQPHGVETGWIPVGTHGIGGNFGILMGPNVGQKQGQDSAGGAGGSQDDSKNQGDQFDIEFENGDPNTPIARHRLFSDKDKPPEVQSGEIFAISKFNASFKLTKDGALSVTTTQKDASGKKDNEKPNMSHSATAGDMSQTVTRANNKGGKHTVTASDGDKKKHTTTMDPVAGTLTHESKDDSKKHSIVLDIAKGITTSTEADLKHTATGSMTSTAQSIVDNASSISHNGNTSVTGTLGVSQLLSALGGAHIGASSFNIDETGIFDATSGGAIAGGLSVDTVTVSNGASVAGGFVADTATVSDGATVAGGLIADTIDVSAGVSVIGPVVTDTLSVTAGADIVGGVIVDTVTVSVAVKLPVYTIAGLAAIASPVAGMMVYVSDTTALAAPVLDAIVTGGGAATVKRPITYNGTVWKY